MAGILEGKRALVTGGGSGIGRASALALARQGAAVAVTDVDDEGGAETVEAIVSEGGKATYVHCDVSKDPDVAAAVARCVEHFGGLDCALNNAGVQGDLVTTANCSKENWDRTIGINLTGTWHCLHHQIPVMTEGGGGLDRQRGLQLRAGRIDRDARLRGEQARHRRPHQGRGA